MHALDERSSHRTIVPRLGPLIVWGVSGLIVWGVDAVTIWDAMDAGSAREAREDLVPLVDIALSATNRVPLGGRE